MKDRLRRASVPVLLLTEILLYGTFLRQDFSLHSMDTAPVKYAGLLLCLLFSLFWSLDGGDWLVTGSLALSAAADVFLLLLDRWYAAGLLLFCGVQALHLRRLFRAGAPLLLPGRLTAAGLSLVLLTALGRLTPLNALAGLYFSQFVCSVISAFSGPERQSRRLYAVGLLLYFCCDSCIGLVQAGLPLSFWLLAGLSRCVWLFYLPGQVLIALSGRRRLPEPYNARLP